METPSKGIVNVSADCFDYVRVFSDGMWNEKHGESILQHPFVRFQVQLLSMVAISHVFHQYLLKRFHFPRLTSDVMSGLVMGATGLQHFNYENSMLLFPPVPNQVFASLLKIGFIVFTFLSAVRMDTNWVKRIGRKGIMLGTMMFAFPFTMTTTLQNKYDVPIPFPKLSGPGKAARDNHTNLYISAFTRSQFVNVSVVLMQLKITNSRLGHLALATALLGDLGMLFNGTLSYIISRVIYTHSVRAGVQSFILLILFLGFITIVMRALSTWFIRITPQGKPMKDLYINVVVATVLILSTLGDTMGVNYLFGPFVLGLMIPAGSPLATALTSNLDTFVYGLLVPLLSTFCASKLNIWVLFTHLDAALNFQMAIIAHVIKLIATFIFVLILKLSYKEAAALTLLLNVKGTVEMGIFLSYTPLDTGDLDCTSGIFLIFVLTSYAPPLIRKLYDPSKHYIGYRKKCIQYTPYDAELEILACAHKPEDAMAAIKLFEISKPTIQSPLTVYGLCLEELVSSFAPLLINHQLGQKSSPSNTSRSQTILDIFKFFNSEFSKSTQVNYFTAVSPLKQMHEDICWLSFDKTCSCIILPFHKKWSSNGKLVSNSIDLRNLNISVFDRAPCSVGILVDRRKDRSLSTIFDSSKVHQVATIFIGGPDDREALAYALRMARSREVRLTVMRFITAEDIVHDSWENMLDFESLRSMRQEMSMTMNITYIEETVRDGSDTAAIIRSVHRNYDLVMVGRRHETKPEVVSGLSQWADYPELGPIGDLLSSSDIDTAVTVSVLVIQQQILKPDHSSVLN